MEKQGITIYFFLRYPKANFEPMSSGQSHSTDVNYCITTNFSGGRCLLLQLRCFSVNLPYGHVWNTVVMSGLAILVATWNCWTSYKNDLQDFGPSLTASLEPLTHRSAYVISIDITLVDVL